MEQIPAKTSSGIKSAATRTPAKKKKKAERKERRRKEEKLKGQGKGNWGEKRRKRAREEENEEEKRKWRQRKKNEIKEGEIDDAKRKEKQQSREKKRQNGSKKEGKMNEDGGNGAKERERKMKEREKIFRFTVLQKKRVLPGVLAGGYRPFLEIFFEQLGNVVNDITRPKREKTKTSTTLQNFSFGVRNFYFLVCISSSPSPSLSPLLSIEYLDKPPLGPLPSSASAFPSPTTPVGHLHLFFRLFSAPLIPSSFVWVSLSPSLSLSSLFPLCLYPSLSLSLSLSFVSLYPFLFPSFSSSIFLPSTEPESCARAEDDPPVGPERSQVLLSPPQTPHTSQVSHVLFVRVTF